jgi:ppGpp synthetase/RelA/SpoT-type nucleotidyltranferase
MRSLGGMALPASRNQINKLGKRLAAGTEISSEDSDMLEDLIACHQEALEQARPRLDELEETVGGKPLFISARPKTTGTIVEKLRRSPQGPLASIQDLAGFRIVGDITFAQQDTLCDEIMHRFPADPREPSRRNRRDQPSHGYRAVHVVVCIDDVSIEIQIRTSAQHLWANMMERLADRLGRQIRYGEPPVPPQGMSQEDAQGLVDVMMNLSRRWTEEPPTYLHGASAMSIDEATKHFWDDFVAGLGQAGD